MDVSAVFIDGTHIKANANTHKNYKAVAEKETRKYEKLSLEEINAERKEQTFFRQKERGYIRCEVKR